MSNKNTRVEITEYSNGGVKVEYTWGASRREYDYDDEGCDCDDYEPSGSLEAVYSSKKEAAKDVADFINEVGDWA